MAVPLLSAKCEISLFTNKDPRRSCTVYAQWATACGILRLHCVRLTAAKGFLVINEMLITLYCEK